jgi:hypothetical protein
MTPTRLSFTRFQKPHDPDAPPKFGFVSYQPLRLDGATGALHSALRTHGALCA